MCTLSAVHNIRCVNILKRTQNEHTAYTQAASKAIQTRESTLLLQSVYLLYQHRGFLPTVALMREVVAKEVREHIIQATEYTRENRQVPASTELPLTCRTKTNYVLHQVAATSEAAQLFRGNSVATNLLSMYTTSVCGQFLSELLGHTFLSHISLRAHLFALGLLLAPPTPITSTRAR